MPRRRAVPVTDPVALAVEAMTARPDLAYMVLAHAHATSPAKITGPASAAALIRQTLGGREVEGFAGVALDSRMKVVDIAVLSTGTSNATIVDPRMVFRWALTRKVPIRFMIVGHNHPSGDCAPSAQDHVVTKTLCEGGEVLNLPVLDHVIVTAGDDYYSFTEAGGIPPRSARPPYINC